MAIADNSIITGKLKGALGKQLVFRQWDGKTIVAKYPEQSTSIITAAQAGTREKFQLAAFYAKIVTTSTDQGLAEAYANVLKPRQNVYNRALGDFMKPPVVEFIDTSLYTGKADDTIVIRATDDFRVTGVRVEIYAADGTLLEAANALQNVNGIDWIYSATQAQTAGITGSKVRAIATDVPGNEGIMETTLA